MDTSAATVVVWRPLMTPGSSARSGEDLRRRVLAFVRKATPFAYCDACLALRLECSLAEMAAALADLADGDAVLARARRSCYGCGRTREISALRDGPPR
jgi:hypothetical protein